MANRTNLFLRASGMALLVAMVPATAQAQASSGQQDDNSGIAVSQDRDADSPATAQDDQQVPTAQTGPSQGAEDIVVTGSRIRNPNLQNLQPTTTVSSQYLDDRNFTNVADALNNLPGIRGSVTSNGAQGSYGQGVNFVNTYGLGSNRTLTLINGRRAVSSNVSSLFNQGSAGTQVDLNIIPTILLDDIDFVSIGGAPIYGSDAIAGTVNIRLRTRLDTGFEVKGTTGITEEGDGFRYNASFAGGYNFLDDRANITFAYSRDRQDGVLYNARDFLRSNYGNATNPSTAQAGQIRGPGFPFADDGRANPNIGYNDGPDDGFPGTVLVNDLTIPFLTPGGVITAAIDAGGNPVAAGSRNFQFDSNGNVIPFDKGIPFIGINASGSSPQAFRFNDFSQIQSELNRDIFNGFLTVDITPSVQFFSEGEYFHSRADELVQQPTFNSNLFGGLSGPVTFTIDSPFLTDQARNELQQRGVSLFQVSRASTDLSDPTGFSETDLYRGVAGLRGDFEAIGRSFNWEVSGVYGRTEIADTSEGLNAQNFVNAVNVRRNAAGDIVCDPNPAQNAAPGGVAPVADSACVPLNLLGNGVSSQTARDYVIQTNTTNSTLEQWVVNANIGGDLFDLFGNTSSFNVGYEHRDESSSFDPSDFSEQGLGRAVGVSPISGSYNIDAGFGEVIVPLVTPKNDLSFVYNLVLNGSGRYVDNSINGGFFAWSAGGKFAPIRDIEFRGNYTKSFRAPAITELFLPTSNAFNTVADLCSPANINSGPVPDTRTRNCNAFLDAFPNATPLDAASATVPSQSGGNPNLDNEIAKSFTYGVILRPRFIPRLSVTVDYIDINIEQPIANLGVGAIVQACFDNENFNLDDPANGNQFCSRIGRYPQGAPGTAANGGPIAGQVISDPQNPAVVSGFINGVGSDFSGIQATANYRAPLSAIGLGGQLGISGNMLYVRRRLVDITGVAPTRSDGTLGDPEFSGQLNLRYVEDSFGLTSSVYYTGEQLFSRTSRGPDNREFDQLKDYATVDAGFFFDIEDKFRLNFSVTNLFDYNGEQYFDAIIPASYTTDGLLGRRFSISASAKF